MRDTQPWIVRLEIVTDLQAKDVVDCLEARGVEVPSFAGSIGRIQLTMPVIDKYGPTNAIQLAMLNVRMAFFDLKMPEPAYISISAEQGNPPLPTVIPEPPKVEEPQPSDPFILRELGRDWLYLKGMVTDPEMRQAVDNIGFWIGKLSGQS